MLIILSGNHTFLRQQALVELKQQIKVEPQTIQIDGLSPAQLTDLLSAQSLFEPRRFILLYGLSENVEVWQRLMESAEMVAEDDSLVLVLIEDKLDSRTKFVKTAKQQGWLQEFVIDTDRYGNVKDYSGQKSIQFILEQAKKLEIKFDRSLAQCLYQQVGPDPWGLYSALERLQIIGDVSRTAINKYIPANPMVNVFNVLGKAFSGQRQATEQAIDNLESIDAEPRMFFGLLSSQMFNILAIASAPAGANLAADLGINPYVIDQLAPIARRCSLADLKQIAGWFIETDMKLKSGSYDAWLEIKVLLNRIIELIA
ncbi:MAG: DNA polymerase III subunit delta [Candidatus Nanosyncoccaceae bacterium]|jgi:DNA polymerase III delta subunit